MGGFRAGGTNRNADAYAGFVEARTGKPRRTRRLRVKAFSRSADADGELGVTAE
jgi:hypothetical protein